MEFTLKLTEFLFCVSWLCFPHDLVLCNDYAESGSDITFTPNIRGKPEEILWTYNDDKVLEYDGSEVLKYGSLKERVDVDFETGQLTIMKLSSQDSGQYESQILIDGRLQRSSHTLTVLDALPEPQVTCEQDGNVKKLLCSVESRTQLRYEWSGPDVKGHLGAELLVGEQEEDQDSVYICTVKNGHREKSTSFTLQDCTAGAATPGALIVALTVTALLILLAVLALLIYRHRKSKRSEQKKMDSENGERKNLLKTNPTEVTSGSPGEMNTELAEKKRSSTLSDQNAQEQEEENEEEKQKQEKEKGDGEESHQLLKETEEMTQDEQTTGDVKEEEKHEGIDTPNTGSPGEMNTELAEKKRSSTLSDQNAQEQEEENEEEKQKHGRTSTEEQRDVLEQMQEDKISDAESNINDKQDGGIVTDVREIRNDKEKRPNIQLSDDDDQNEDDTQNEETTDVESEEDEDGGQKDKSEPEQGMKEKKH